MIRNPEKSSLDQDPHFRWRGGDVSRIENLSDIVFALSLSLLAVASSPPGTFTELLEVFKGAFAFGFSFMILLLIWNYHYVYFRRYGLNDQMTVFLNAALLFVVLLFVYPLRFLAEFVFALIAAFFTGFEHVVEMGVTLQAGATLLVVYSFGYAAVFLIIAGLYNHAVAMRETLELTDQELILTRRTRASAISQAGIALLIAGIAAFTPLGPWSGPLYFLIGPAQMIIQKRYLLKE